MAGSIEEPERRQTPRIFTSTKTKRFRLPQDRAYILGSLLVSLYPGQVIIPDFGFYAPDFHAWLIRQGRLAIGVIALAELDKKMQRMVLLIKDKIGRHCTFDDAETLARYAGTCQIRRSFDLCAKHDACVALCALSSPATTDRKALT